jgi:hypothetical protein
MGTPRARALVGVAAIAAAVVLFIVLSAGDDDEASTTTTTVATTTQATGGDGNGGGEPSRPPKPEVPTIVVKGGEPVGGVAELTFNSGDDIRFNVESDAAAEVHFHGYDVSQEVEAGGEVSFDVPADIEGVFEVELEETATQIAEITVEP